MGEDHAGGPGGSTGSTRRGALMRWFGRRDRDYREELETHIEIEVRENLERGMAPDAARQAALRTFGNALAVRERLQEARPFRFWEVLSRDIRYGTRLLTRTPV